MDLYIVLLPQYQCWNCIKQWRKKKRKKKRKNVWHLLNFTGIMLSADSIRFSFVMQNTSTLNCCLYLLVVIFNGAHEMFEMWGETVHSSHSRWRLVLLEEGKGHLALWAISCGRSRHRISQGCPYSSCGNEGKKNGGGGHASHVGPPRGMQSISERAVSNRLIAGSVSAFIVSMHINHQENHKRHLHRLLERSRRFFMLIHILQLLISQFNKQLTQKPS